MKKQNNVIYIDPASISSGWAIYAHAALKDSGTFVADRRLDIAKRLSLVYNYYYKLMLKHKIKEAHIERLVRNTHIHTHWSVGVIMAACSNAGVKASADIAIAAWQRYTGWKKLTKTAQTDEQAAICMGKYYEENISNT